MAITVKVPKIKIEIPDDKTFWKAVGIEQARVILKKTLQGQDYQGRRFKPYEASTVSQRAKRGREVGKVNLTDTGRMLRAMFRGIRPRKGGVSIHQLGSAGTKTYYNEARGREFFSVSKAQQKTITTKIKKWMTKKNGLK